jgi:nucleoside-diphosphate-sugar epimerase
MQILVIGGTRNIGHYLVPALLDAGHSVTLLNRGLTPDALPEELERLRADRTDPFQLERVLVGRSFDVVVDNALYKGAEAETIIRLLQGRVGQYIFISTGQVYLVREGIERPFSEGDYAGRVMPQPVSNTYAHTEWLYGIEKRQAEDAMAKAWAAHQFPYTALRLPMVNSERDHMGRLYSYVLRLQDGGPILVPETPGHLLRHIDVQDVVQAILRCVEHGPGRGQAYNISQEETVTLDAFLGIIGAVLGVEPKLLYFRRQLLEANGFLPDCSPFSERWMSELTNDLSKTALGMTYTPLPVYLRRIVESYLTDAPREPVGYKRRHAELQFAAQSVGG